MQARILSAITFLQVLMNDLYCRQLVKVEEANNAKRQALVDNVNASKAALQQAQRALGAHDHKAAEHTTRMLDELDFFGYND